MDTLTSSKKKSSSLGGGGGIILQGCEERKGMCVAECLLQKTQRAKFPGSYFSVVINQEEQGGTEGKEKGVRYGGSRCS